MKLAQDLLSLHYTVKSKLTKLYVMRIPFGAVRTVFGTVVVMVLGTLYFSSCNHAGDPGTMKECSQLVV